MKNFKTLLIGIISFFAFQTICFAYEDCDLYHVRKILGYTDQDVLYETICTNPTDANCVINAMNAGTCKSECPSYKIGDDIKDITDACFECFSNECLTPNKAEVLKGVLISQGNKIIGTDNPAQVDTSDLVNQCKLYLDNEDLLKSSNNYNPLFGVACRNPKKSLCAINSISNGGNCYNYCYSTNTLSGFPVKTDSNCISCILGDCFDAQERQYITPILNSHNITINQDIISGNYTPQNNDQNSAESESVCNSKLGQNCNECSSKKRPVCIEACAQNHVYNNAECYSSCVVNGVEQRQNEECFNCLKNFCPYDELKAGFNPERNYRDPEINLSEEWNFCDKHGVLKSMQILNRAIFVAKIIVPILLIVFGIIELSKAFISADDKAINNSVNSLIKKVVIALIVFFIPTIVKAVFNQIDDYTNLNSNGCYVCLFDEGGNCNDLIANSNDE